MGPFYGHATMTNTAPTPVSGPGRFAKTKVDRSWDFVKVQGRQDWIDEDMPRVDMFSAVRTIQKKLGREPKPLHGPKDDDGMQPLIGLEYDSRVTIVCVNPVVVAIEPVPMTLPPSAMHGQIKKSVPTLPYPTHVFGKAVLPHGVEARPRVATRDGLLLLDFSIDSAPGALTVQEDGVAHWPTRWGALEFTPDGDGWEVRGVPHAKD